MTSGMRSVVRYVASDVVRSRFVLVYGLVFLVISECLVRFVGVTRVLPALINVVVPLVPLVSIIFAMSYVYHSLPTVEMLLAQPIRRSSVFAGLHIGMMLPVAVIPALALGLPTLLRPGATGIELVLVLSSAVLSTIFIGIGFWTAMRFKDRVSGLTFALFLWFFLTVGYDGLVLVGTQVFADYPLEAPLIAAMMFNPVDLVRVLLLSLSDLSAMMGYTGALFLRMFTSVTGAVVAALALTVWIVLPVLASGRRFVLRDF